MTENNDKTVFDEAFLTDRIRIVGADYLLCNILVIFGGGAAATAALRLGSKGTDLAAVFLCMSLLFAIVWLFFNINAGNPHSVFYRVISKTVEKNKGKYGFDEAYYYRGYNGTILIDTEGGRIAYLSNMNPWKFQMISAGEIGKLSVSHVPYMSQAFTTYVYFQFYHKGRRIRIPTFATSGNGRSLADKEVAQGVSDAENGIDNLRLAKQAALMSEGRKKFDKNSIIPANMWTLSTEEDKRMIYDVSVFETELGNAINDLEQDKVRSVKLSPQESFLGLTEVTICVSPDPGILYIEYTVSNDKGSGIPMKYYVYNLKALDVLSICTELFLKKDPRMDGEKDGRDQEWGSSLAP
ncbi:MAG: hypothetical protein J6X66_01560 [Lachnospiraceae bacterium]|nr:hypothetical protein [Lachnospiraceae bacterium]